MDHAVTADFSVQKKQHLFCLLVVRVVGEALHLRLLKPHLIEESDVDYARK